MGRVNLLLGTTKKVIDFGKVAQDNTNFHIENNLAIPHVRHDLLCSRFPIANVPRITVPPYQHILVEIIS